MFQKNKMSSIIGPDFKVDGDISINGNIIVYGEVRGNVICDGLLTMSKKAVIIGDIKTSNADISGTIEGDLRAKEKISLSSSSILKGNLSASILVIQDGATFNGLCTMASKEKNISIAKIKKIASLNEQSKK